MTIHPILGGKKKLLKEKGEKLKQPQNILQGSPICITALPARGWKEISRENIFFFFNSQWLILIKSEAGSLSFSGKLPACLKNCSLPLAGKH